MTQQETLCRCERADSVLELWEAPRPRQVVDLLPRPTAGARPQPAAETVSEHGPEHGTGLAMALGVMGNVLGGSVWLAALLAAPAVLGRLLGLL